MRTPLSPALLAGLSFCASPSAPLRAAYGDTLIVEGRVTTVLSPGWVILNETRLAPAPDDLSILAPVRWTLMDLNGAPYGDMVAVAAVSPIPPGWVVLRTLRGRQGEATPIRLLIRNLAEEPVATPDASPDAVLEGARGTGPGDGDEAKGPDRDPLEGTDQAPRPDPTRPLPWTYDPAGLED
jgi:hypothetical protein